MGVAWAGGGGGGMLKLLIDRPINFPSLGSNRWFCFPKSSRLMGQQNWLFLG